MFLLCAAEQGRRYPGQERPQALREGNPNEAVKRKQAPRSWRSVVKVSSSSLVDTRGAYYVLFTGISNYGSSELGTCFTDVCRSRS